MVHEGKTAEQAAQAVGYKPNSLVVALKKPHVAQFKTRVFREFKDGLAEKSIARIDVLAETAKSESVRADCNKQLIALDERFKPASTVNHRHSGEIMQHTPGYVIQLGEDEPWAAAPSPIKRSKKDIILH